jgi:hypothetical protein
VSSGDIIRASEIASFAYCARAWWLGDVQGVPSDHPSALTAGTAGHRAHGRAVTWAVWMRRLGLALMALALLALGTLLVLWTRG